MCLYLCSRFSIICPRKIHHLPYINSEKNTYPITRIVRVKGDSNNRGKTWDDLNSSMMQGKYWIEGREREMGGFKSVFERIRTRIQPTHTSVASHTKHML